jgi:hypothetical protein
MSVTAIQTVAAVIQAVGALVFLGSVWWEAVQRNRERQFRARLDEQERRDRIIDRLLFVWNNSANEKTYDEIAGFYSQRQIEFFNERLKKMGENWTYPFERVQPS